MRTDDVLDGGGPAFPLTYPNGEKISVHTGASLRDYFAGQALIALMSSDRWVRELDEATAKAGRQFKPAIAEHAYRMADAMLAEREKP